MPIPKHHLMMFGDVYGEGCLSFATDFNHDVAESKLPSKTILGVSPPRCVCFCFPGIFGDKFLGNGFFVSSYQGEEWWQAHWDLRVK